MMNNTRDLSRLQLKAGDRVLIYNAFGQLRTGKVRPFLIFNDHVVLDMGGEHDTAQIADAANIVAVNGKRVDWWIEPARVV